MRCEIVAVGTELLLGQIVDTNSAWMGEQLALAGIDCTHQQTVGDNLERIVGALELALGRADAVIVCGGLGPTQDDITRNAIAQVMGVRLVQDDDVVDRILERFAARGRRMPANNLLQAQVPEGATAIADPQPGTAPGLICPVGEGGKVIYAVPGVPYEMQEIVAGAVLPDMQRRAGNAGHHPLPDAAHVGRQRVGPGRAAGRAHGRARRRRARGPHPGVPGQRDRGAQGAHHGQGRRRGPRPQAAGRRGAGRAGHPRRHRVRRRRGDDGARGGEAARPAGAHAGGGRVADRGTGRRPGWSTCPARAAGSGAASCPTPRTSSTTCWGCPRGPWSRPRRRRRWRTGCGDGSAPTSGWASPAWPGPTSRRASGRERCSWRWPWVTTSPSWRASGSRAIATGSASSPASRCWTCCGGGSTVSAEAAARDREPISYLAAMRLFVGVRPPDDVLDLHRRPAPPGAGRPALDHPRSVARDAAVPGGGRGSDGGGRRPRRGRRQRVRRLRGGRRPDGRDAVAPGRGAPGRRARRRRCGGDRGARARSVGRRRTGPSGGTSPWPGWPDRRVAAPGASPAGSWGARCRRGSPCPTSGSSAATWGGAAPATRTSMCATWAE